MLYSVLFEMRKDIAELRAKVSNLTTAASPVGKSTVDYAADENPYHHRHLAACRGTSPAAVFHSVVWL
jgi:hypothetical protein